MLVDPFTSFVKGSITFANGLFVFQQFDKLCNYFVARSKLNQRNPKQNNPIVSNHSTWKQLCLQRYFGGMTSVTSTVIRFHHWNFML